MTQIVSSLGGRVPKMGKAGKRRETTTKVAGVLQLIHETLFSPPWKRILIPVENMDLLYLQSKKKGRKRSLPPFLRFELNYCRTRLAGTAPQVPAAVAKVAPVTSK